MVLRKNMSKRILYMNFYILNNFVQKLSENEINLLQQKGEWKI